VSDGTHLYVTDAGNSRIVKLLLADDVVPPPSFPTTHRDVEVLDYMSPNRADSVKKETSRKVVVIGPSHGLRKATALSEQPVEAIPIRWLASGLDEIDLLLYFVGARKGKARPVWIPSGQQDFVPVSMTALGGTAYLVFQKFGYAELMYPAYLGRKDVAIYPADGSEPVYASVTFAVDNGDGTETITLDNGAALAPLAAGIATAKISFLLLCRLASDDVEISWATNTVAESTLKFIEVPQNEIPALMDHSAEVPDWGEIE
jgi:hypothetical protein